ncbi:MAG: hypothetical protein NZT61_02470 [Deltaproteobacteria bacterium]|nr:hypothetical protein [Deltaproteobacteria bacterium]MCX7952667.1 hypothetical protein [Deltaproteobacteria bacterium]
MDYLENLRADLEEVNLLLKMGNLKTSGETRAGDELSESIRTRLEQLNVAGNLLEEAQRLIIASPETALISAIAARMFLTDLVKSCDDRERIEEQVNSVVMGSLEKASTQLQIVDFDRETVDKFFEKLRQEVVEKIITTSRNLRFQ